MEHLWFVSVNQEIIPLPKWTRGVQERNYKSTYPASWGVLGWAWSTEYWRDPGPDRRPGCSRVGAETRSLSCGGMLSRQTRDFQSKFLQR